MTRSTPRRPGLAPAVVLGTNVTGLTQARALAHHGVPVIGIDSRMRRYTSYSGAFGRVITTPAFDSPDLLAVLERIAGQSDRRPTLFISTDEQVKIVAQARDTVRRWFNLDFPPAPVVDLLMSKEAFTRTALERGWPVPVTRFAASQDDLLGSLAGLRFPVVLKPRIKNLASRLHASQKAYRCRDREELIAAYRDVGRWEPEVIVQEWIAGTDADVCYSFHYFTADGKELGGFVGRKIRQWIPEVGSTASSEPLDHPAVATIAREVLTGVGCVGFCSVEFKRDPVTDRLFITEPTVGRPNLQLGTAIVNGVDLVSRAYAHLNGVVLEPERPPRRPRKWLILKCDLRSARHYVNRGELTWWRYWRSLAGPKRYAIWSARDPKMLVGAIGTWVRRLATVPFRLMRRSSPARAAE